MAITINPVVTTNAAGSFSVTLDGLMQGMAMDDPSIRNQLTGGQLAVSETLPMFGGIPIIEYLPATGITTDPSLQTQVARATNALAPTGISVFNQNHAMVNSPQSPVPAAAGGQLVNLYRFGSGARIAMALDPAFTPTIAAPGMPISPTALFFSVANQYVTATATSNVTLPVSCKIIGFNLGNSMIVNYNAGTGFATWTRNGNAVLLQI